MGKQGPTVDQLKRMTEPQEKVAYVSQARESGQNVVQGKVQSGINTHLLCSRSCLVSPLDRKSVV